MPKLYSHYYIRLPPSIAGIYHKDKMSIDLMPVDFHPERKPIYQSCHIHTLLSQLQAVFSLHSDYAHHICIGIHTKKEDVYKRQGYMGMARILQIPVESSCQGDRIVSPQDNSCLLYTSEKAVYDLRERVTPGYASQYRLEMIQPENGSDVYEVDGDGPVSSTHLDVYKRQIEWMNKKKNITMNMMVMRD